MIIRSCWLNSPSYFILAVFGLNVHPIELIVSSQLIALAFKNFDDCNFLAKEYRQETFENIEIRLLSQQTLDSPVETNVFVLQFMFHNL